MLHRDLYILFNHAPDSLLGMNMEKQFNFTPSCPNIMVSNELCGKKKDLSLAFLLMKFILGSLLERCP